MSLGEKYTNFVFNNKEVIDLITSSNTNALSKIEALFLLYIYNKGKVAMGEISSFFNLPQSTTLFTVNKLIDLAYVSRERNDEDRRIVNITLTDFGHNTAKNLINITTNQFSKILDLLEKKIEPLLNDDEKEIINRLLHRIREI